MLKLLDAPHKALGWPATVKSETWDNQGKYTQVPTADAIGEAVPPSGLKSETLQSRVKMNLSNTDVPSGCSTLLQSIERRVGKAYSRRSRDIAI
jgi:hypothetical protein